MENTVMKNIRLFALVLVTVAVFTGTIGFTAEYDPSPFQYLNEQGLTVMDENQIQSAFGSVSLGGDPFTSWFPNESYSVFSYSEYNRLPTIVFRLDGKIYLAVEMAALQGNGTISAETVSHIFADLCSWFFDFDVMMASNDGYKVYLCSENPDIYAKLQSFIQAQNDSTNSTVYDSITSFLFDAVYNVDW